jgi:hypothetical protein
VPVPALPNYPDLTTVEPIKTPNSPYADEKKLALEKDSDYEQDGITVEAQSMDDDLKAAGEQPQSPVNIASIR